MDEGDTRETGGRREGDGERPSGDTRERWGRGVRGLCISVSRGSGRKVHTKPGTKHELFIDFAAPPKRNAFFSKRPGC